MERKKIDNMVEYCKKAFYCTKCPYAELCGDIDDKVSMIHAPLGWNDEDIDYILDKIN